jgi:uncharacterized membrane protein
VAPVAAMKLSFSACLRNTAPFLVYGLVVLGMWLVMSLPAAAGIIGSLLVAALLIASIPVLICSVYASYQDVFTAPRGASTTGGNPLLR